jgi:hypothetical protein
MHKSDIIKEHEHEYTIEDNPTDKEKIMGLDPYQFITMLTLT